MWYSLKFNIKGEAMVYERRRIKGCFLENLELDEFPFDTQVCVARITVTNDDQHLFDAL